MAAQPEDEPVDTAVLDAYNEPVNTAVLDSYVDPLPGEFETSPFEEAPETIPPPSEAATVISPILEEEEEEEEQPAPVPSGRGRRFWVRSFALGFTTVLLFIVALGALGVYQGLQDRQLQNRQAAVEYFNKGQLLLQEEKYDLAMAHFREALRLEPQFEAAAQAMAIAESRASAQASQTQEAEPVVAPDAEKLFQAATESLQKGEWEMAAGTFDLLHSQAPGFRAEEVKAGLFEARLEAGRAALEAGELDSALRNFDHALALKPEDQALLELRKLAAAYRSGQRALRRGDWGSAADQLRAVYLLNPSFLEVRELLAEAHLELGKEFEQRDIWCEAAQQYRASVTIKKDDRIDELARTANSRCNRREVAAPAPTIEPESDEVGAIAGSPTPSPTPTPTPVPTSIARSTGFAYQPAGAIGESFDASCGGHYIRGIVRGLDGTPLAGVTILVRDEFGNQMIATTKSDPLGAYDLPISEHEVSYEVMVVTGDQPVSPKVAVRHSERFAQSPQACHILNWQQTGP